MLAFNDIADPLNIAEGAGADPAGSGAPRGGRGPDAMTAPFGQRARWGWNSTGRLPIPDLPDSSPKCLVRQELGAPALAEILFTLIEPAELAGLGDRPPASA